MACLVFSAEHGLLRRGPPFHGSRLSREVRNSECKLSNGWLRSYKVMKLQGAAAAKGGWQKEFDHFFSFSVLFRSLFGHFF